MLDETTILPVAGHISDGQGLDSIASGVKKKETRGRKPGKVTKPAADVSPELVQAYADLYQGKHWEEIGALYFNVRLAMTGDSSFKLEKDQKEQLGASLALVMKSLMAIAP